MKNKIGKIKVKVNCTLVQALRLCTGRTAYRGSRCIALLFLDHGTRREWGVSVTPRPLFTPGKDPVPTVQKAGWDPRPVWTGAENLASTGIRTPDCPVRSQSLYRQSSPAVDRESDKCIKKFSSKIRRDVTTWEIQDLVERNIKICSINVEEFRDWLSNIWLLKADPNPLNSNEPL